VSDSSNKQTKRESPLAKSALFSGTAPGQSLPALPTQQIHEQVVSSPAQSQPIPEEEELLYLSEPSAEYIGRPFDRKRDKGAINGNPYLLGAVDAINRLRDIDKYKAYDEMCMDYIEKYKELLERRPDVVRDQEAKYRKKHHL
jgi:hypothetical protein